MKLPPDVHNRLVAEVRSRASAAGMLAPQAALRVQVTSDGYSITCMVMESVEARNAAIEKMGRDYDLGFEFTKTYRP